MKKSVNDKKIGERLAELRRNKHLTQSQLATALGYRSQTIHDWEKGSLPSLYMLIDVCDYYGITIDELIESEPIITNEQLLDKYPIFQPREDIFKNPDWKKIDFYIIHQNQLLLINKNLKKLIIRYRASLLSRNEDIELRFLFNNMCSLSEFFKESEYDRKDNDYVSFLSVLDDLKVGNTTDDSFYWEAQKYFDIADNYDLSTNLGVWEATPKEDEFLDKKYKQLEPWEKDMMLARFQCFEPIANNESNSFFLKKYEDKYGKEFDKERVIKEIIKYLVNNGAVLNPYFMVFKHHVKYERKVIDRLTEIYEMSEKPIAVYYHDYQNENSKTIKAYIKNTKWNRFLDQYYDFSFYFDNKLSPKEVYRLLTTDSEKEVVYLFAKKYNLDETKKYKYVKADVKMELNHWNEKKRMFLKKEKEIDDAKRELPSLIQKLNNGEMTYVEEKLEVVGPKKLEEYSEYINMWKSQLSFSEFNKWRKKSLTIKMLEEIDNLSLNEIRGKYFPMEVID